MKKVKRKISSTVSLPSEVWEKLDKVKAVYGTSHNFVIEKALEAYFAEDIEFKEKKV